MPVFVHLPTEVESLQWTGDNLVDMQMFTGNRGLRHHDSWTVPAFTPIGTYLHPDLCEGATAELWVEANKQLVPIMTGEWVIKDELGCYPCKDEVFVKSYELKESND